MVGKEEQLKDKLSLIFAESRLNCITLNLVKTCIIRSLVSEICRIYSYWCK